MGQNVYKTVNAYKYLEDVQTDILTADVTKNNSVALSDSGLSIAVEANSQYWLEVGLFYQSTAVADIDLGFSYPAGCQILWGTDYLHWSGAGAALLLIQTNEFEATGLGAGASGGIHLFCYILNGATAGTVMLQFAQHVAEISNTIILEGSSLRAIRLN